MGFVDSLRAKLPGGKDDGKPKKKTAKEIFAEGLATPHNTPP